MKVTIRGTATPHLAQWVQVLVDEGWKLTHHGPNSIRAKNHLGQSKYPQKNTTVWYLTITEVTDDSACKAVLDVPAFCHSPFSKARIYEEFEELVKKVGRFETDDQLEIDLLGQLRD